MSSQESGSFARETIRVGRTGGRFVSKVDNRITVEFPPHSLDKTYRFEFEFQKIDVGRFSVYRRIDEGIGCITGFSGILHVKNKMPRIPGVVKLTLPLLYDTGDNEDVEVVFLRMKDYMDRGLGPPLPADSPNGYFNIDITDFSILTDNFSAWKVRKGVSETRIKEAAKYLTGQLSYCTLLTFIQYDEKEPWLLLNCVDVADAEAVTGRYLAEGYQEIINSRPRHLTMTTGVEVKVELQSNIRPAPEVDKVLLKGGLKFSGSDVSNGIRFPFKTISGPQDDSVVCFEEIHTVSFKLSEYKPVGKEAVKSPVTKIETFADERREQFKHVGEGCYIEINPDKTFSDIEIKPAAYRSDVISKNKKTGNIVSEVLDIFTKTGNKGELHIPVNLPKTILSPRKLYNFYVVNQTGDQFIKTEIEKWPKQMESASPFMVKARVGDWTGFSVIAEKKTEHVTVTNEGGVFESQIDRNVVFEVPKNVCRETRIFEIKLNEVDQTRVEGYRSENPEMFGVIKSITSGIDIRSKGAGQVSGFVKVTLPIREDPEPDDPNTEVVLIRCDTDNIEEIPVEKSKQKNYYTAETKPFKSAVLIRRKKHGTKKAINAIRYLNGETNLCTLMTFIHFNDGKDKPMVRFECTYNFKANAISDKHRKEGFLEIPKSRSSDRVVQDKERISMTLLGNLKIPVHTPKYIYSIIFLQHSSTNHATIPIEVKKERMGNQYSIVEYAGNKGCTRHTIHVMLDERGIANLLLSGEDNSEETERSILSEPSLKVLGKQLSWRDWEDVGTELGVSQAILDDIRRRNEDHNRPLRLLHHWIGETKGNESTLAGELVAALEEIGREHVAEVLRKAIDGGTRLKRRDFN